MVFSSALVNTIWYLRLVCQSFSASNSSSSGPVGTAIYVSCVHFEVVDTMLTRQYSTLVIITGDKFKRAQESKFIRKTQPKS